MLFSLYASEKNNSWEMLPENPADEVLRMLENNPFACLTDQIADVQYNHVRLDRAKILAELTRPLGDEDLISVRMSADDPMAVEAIISRSDSDNNITLMMNAEDLSKLGKLESVTSYMQEWRFVLPAFFSSSASADDRENDFFYDELALPLVPECIGNTVGWYHVLSPLGYQDYFKREDLINAPAYKVEELTDKTICLMTYPHPLEFASEESTERISKLTKYLYERWMAHVEQHKKNN